jgi:integrase/recombinase XerC
MKTCEFESGNRNPSRKPAADVIEFPAGKPAAERKAKAWIQSPDKFLTDREYDRLLGSVRERRDAALQRGAFTAIRDAALVITLAKSGLRIGEAVDLIWSDLHLRSSDGRPPAILVRNGKGGKSRLVVIGEDLRRELKQWREACEARGLPVGPDDLVFRSQRGSGLTVSGAERIISGAMARAGIAGKRNPHRLRHSYPVEWESSAGFAICPGLTLGRSPGD